MTGLRSRGFEDSSSWYLRTGAYWFAVSFKWFALFLLQPFQIARIVPGGEQNTAWGTIVALGAVEAMLGPAVMGWLSDRTRSRWGRRRPFLAAGAVVTTVALVWLAHANTLAAMAGAFLLLQVADDIATGPYSSFVPEVVPENRRGRASAVLGVLQLTAQVVAVGVGLAFSDIAVVYWVAAGLNLVCAAITLSALPPASFETELATRREGPERLSPFSAFRNPDFRWTWITRFLVAFGFYLILLYVGNFLKDEVPDLRLFGWDLGEPSRAALVAAVVIAITGAIGALAVGKATDTSRKRVIRNTGFVMFASIAAFAFVRDFEAMVAIAAVFGVAYGAYQTASWALASDVLPDPSSTAKDMGIWQASIATPQVLHLLLGRLVDSANRGSAGSGYTLAFLVASIAFLGGCVLVGKIQRSR